MSETNASQTKNSEYQKKPSETTHSRRPPTQTQSFFWSERRKAHPDFDQTDMTHTARPHSTDQCAAFVLCCTCTARIATC
jgi:hypothetical protein